MPYANYLKYYTIEDGRVQIHFNQMNEETEKNYLRNLSKEEKRKVTEDAKLMHMVSEIKRDDYGDGGPDHTPSIINVVKDPNKVY